MVKIILVYFVYLERFRVNNCSFKFALKLTKMFLRTRHLFCCIVALPSLVFLFLPSDIFDRYFQPLYEPGRLKKTLSIQHIEQIATPSQ